MIGTGIKSLPAGFLAEMADGWLHDDGKCRVMEVSFF